MKRTLINCLAAVGWYALLIAGGIVMTLALSSLIGYLPYSDRPGPGWVGPSLAPGQLGFYALWALSLLAPGAIICGTVIFAYHLLLAFLDTPVWLLRVTAGVIAGLVSLTVTASAGWYIAVAPYVVWVGGGLGVVWGTVVLPRYVEIAGINLRPAPRTAAVVLTLLVPIFLAYTALMTRESQYLDYMVLQISDVNAAETREGSFELSPREAEILDSLFPKAHVDYLVRGAQLSGADVDSARMLIVVTEPPEKDVRLRVPRTTSVVYAQREDGWDMIPANTATTGRKVVLGKTGDPNEFTFAWPDGEPVVYRLSDPSLRSRSLLPFPHQ